MSIKSQALREERSGLVTKVQAILRESTMTVEKRMEAERLSDAAEKIVPQIQQEERSEAEAIQLAEGRRVVDGYGARFETQREREHRMAFMAFSRFGLDRISAEQRAKVLEYRDTDNSAQGGTATGVSYLTGSAGGYFVPASFQHEIDQKMKYFCPVLDGKICRVIQTDSGAVLPFPTGDDTGNVGVLVSENTSVSEVPVVVGSKNLGAYKFSTQVIRVSVELLQDSAFDLDGYLGDRFAERIGRAMEQYATTGTGVAQPTGIITAALAGGSAIVVGAGSNANDGEGFPAFSTIGTNDLIDLEHAVDIMYRRGGRFLLHDSTLKVIKKLLDKYGRPIWLPGLTSNAPDTILGYPYVVDNAMATPVANTNPTSVLFGDTSHFVIRRVRDLSVLRLSERYAEYGQVGFLGFSRMDSNLVQPAAVALLQQHS